MYYLLIGEMSCFDHHDRVPMVSVLVYMNTHCIGPTINHDLRLLGSHNFTKLLFYIVS